MSEDIFDLTGRVALITGASSHGIGNSAAKILAAHGAKVFLTARRAEKLEAACKEIEEAGGIAAYRPTDVSTEEECKAAVEACVAEFGRLDIMVLSAGISGLSASGGYDAIFDSDNFNKVLATNLGGTWNMIKYGAPECGKNGVGSIITVGSLASMHADGSAAYTCTKGAIRMLTQWCGKRFARDGMNVRINAVYPGLVDTDMTHRACVDEKWGPIMLQPIPLGRFGQPEDIANGVLYLASDASSWVTGQHLVIDGGQLC